jgi:hypothetical protein
MTVPALDKDAGRSDMGRATTQTDAGLRALLAAPSMKGRIRRVVRAPVRRGTAPAFVEVRPASRAAARGRLGIMTTRVIAPRFCEDARDVQGERRLSRLWGVHPVDGGAAAAVRHDSTC